MHSRYIPEMTIKIYMSFYFGMLIKFSVKFIIKNFSFENDGKN